MEEQGRTRQKTTTRMRQRRRNPFTQMFGESVYKVNKELMRGVYWPWILRVELLDSQSVSLKTWNGINIKVPIHSGIPITDSIHYECSRFVRSCTKDPFSITTHPSNETLTSSFMKFVVMAATRRYGPTLSPPLETSDLNCWISYFCSTIIFHNPKEGYIQVDLPSSPKFNKESTIIAYHGSRTCNWYSILRLGLENRSNTPAMKNGAIEGPGIYLSTDLPLAREFSSFDRGWDHCPLGSALEIVGVFQVLKVSISPKSPPGYVIVENSESVRLVGFQFREKRNVQTWVDVWILISCILVLLTLFLCNMDHSRYIKKIVRLYKRWI